MRYPADETAKKHTQLVDKASRLFRDRGFKDVSIAEAMKAAGLTHGAFYSHFDSKNALVAASVDHAMEGTLSRVNDSFATTGGRGALEDWYLSASHRDSPSAGCTMAALATEIRNEPGARSAFTGKLKEILAALGGDRGEAMTVLATMVGAMALARAVDDEEFSDEILNNVRSRLD